MLSEITRSNRVAPLPRRGALEQRVDLQPWARGQVKQRATQARWPAETTPGTPPGTPHDIDLVEEGWGLRDYRGARSTTSSRAARASSCSRAGAGKTIVARARWRRPTRRRSSFVTNTVSARQWRAELLKRTTLTEDEIGEYSGERKEIKPVTIATYQILTAKRKGEFAHLALLDALDGASSLRRGSPAAGAVFKLTAELQARRRLGLTATLVRETPRVRRLFSLIGPKRFDARGKEIEAQGFISPAACFEVRVDLPADDGSSTRRAPTRSATASPPRPPRRCASYATSSRSTRASASS